MIPNPSGFSPFAVVPRLAVLFRRRFSFRSGLTLAVPLLIALTTGFIAWRARESATHEVSLLASAQFAEAARQAIARTESELHTAVQTLDELRDLARLGALPDDDTQLGRHFLAILRAHPAYTWVSYSNAQGHFVGARRDKGRYFVNLSAPGPDGKVKLREYSVADDNQMVLHRQSEDHGYDPRTRPFYTQAVAAKGLVWTRPYVFFEDAATPGITCAAPRYDAAEALVGVFTVDFNLAGLSRLLAGVQLGSSGVLTLTTDKGELLAHPTAPLVATAGTTLLSAADSSDQVVRTLARLPPKILQSAAMPPTAARAPTVVGHAEAEEQVEIKGETWLVRRVQALLTSSLVLNVWAAAPAREFLAGVDKNAQENAVVMLGALLVGMLIALAFAGLLSTPLQRLALGMERVGKFELEAEPAGGSVFAELDSMEQALEAMKGSLRSFASFVPRDLVKRLLADRGELRVDAEQRDLTVFFSDIEGFTTLAESTEPTQLVSQLSRYLSVVTGVLGEYRATVDKFLGDGVMAFWNAPEPLPDHAVLAVRAAMRLKQRLNELRAAGEPSALNTRIGLARGEVIVGTIGTAERLNYTALGDTVNLAARLEGMNKHYGTKILCNHAVKEAAEHAIVFRPIDLAQVRGKTVRQRIYEPMGERSAPGAQRWEEIAALCEQALVAREEGDIYRAGQCYDRALELNPADKVLQTLAALCTEQANPPPLR